MVMIYKGINGVGWGLFPRSQAVWEPIPVSSCVRDPEAFFCAGGGFDVEILREDRLTDLELRCSGKTRQRVASGGHHGRDRTVTPF